MKFLVTGGAGFIGSNFILYWLKNHPQDLVVNLDKLTYAGNLENLQSVQNNPNYKFVQGDICDATVVNQVVKDVDALCISQPKATLIEVLTSRRSLSKLMF